MFILNITLFHILNHKIMNVKKIVDHVLGKKQTTLDGKIVYHL